MKKYYTALKKRKNLFKRCTALTLSAAIALSMLAADAVSICNENIYAENSDIVYGDVNSDGVINVLDMIFFKSYITENNTDGFSVKSADLDDDGKISAKDAVELSMYLLSKTSSFSYEMNVDTDNDGLCDYVEKEILGTDPNKKDTDGDGLNDYCEVYLCDTDPLNEDTGNTGVKDLNKDTDGDGLTNGEEMTLGTSLTLEDSDDDGLTDYDEAKKYKTDPLSYDTDNDGISDYGELKLGLDPLKEKTDGETADSDRVFEQKADSENVSIRMINIENAEYELSVSAKASGYIDEAINVDISAYSNFLQNDAVAGDIVDIDYNNLFKLENLIISFKVTGNAEDYFVFRYFEEVNMLLPVDTEYDGNIVYTESPEDGTYCLVNVELWSENMLTSSENEYADSVFDPVHASSGVDGQITKDGGAFEVFFLMYSTKDNLDIVRSSVINASSLLSDYAKKNKLDIKLYYWNYNGMIRCNNDTEYLDSSATKEEIISVLDKLAVSPINMETFAKYPMIKQINSMKNYYVKSQNPKYCFVINAGAAPPVYFTSIVYAPDRFDAEYDPDKYLSDYRTWLKMESYPENLQYLYTGDIRIAETGNIDENILVMSKEYNVKFSLICNEGNIRFNRYSSNLLPDGKAVILLSNNFSDEIADEVTSKNSYVATYNIKTTMFSSIIYDEKIITSDWKDIYSKYTSGKMTIEEINKLGLPDTDRDGYPDCLEINMACIDFDENGMVILPTFNELADKAYNSGNFSMNGYNEIKKALQHNGKATDFKVIPLISNPTLEDSDFDGILDNEDSIPSKENIITVNDSILNDSNIFEEGYSTISNKKVIGSGAASSHIGVKKNNYIEYDRIAPQNTNSTSKFYIEPNVDSDYLITVATGLNDECKIKVTYESGILIWKKDKSVSSIKLDEGIKEKEQNGNRLYNKKAFSLKKGMKYKVSVTVKSSDKSDGIYNVSFEQNNWIYAPNGGVLSVRPYTFYFDIEKMFISQEKLIASINEIAPSSIEVKLENEPIEDQVASVMTALNISDNNVIVRDFILTVFSALFGGSSFVGSIMLPEPTNKIIIGVALDAISVYFLVETTNGLVSYIETSRFKEACLVSDFNVIYTKAGYESFNAMWDPWKTHDYIYKYSQDKWNGRVICDFKPNRSINDIIEYCGWNKR